MKHNMIRIGRLIVLMIFCSGLTACEDPQVYGSIGVSSYGGGGYHGGGYYGGNPRVGGSISIGGRIY
jgi:hypothetical protein